MSSGINIFVFVSTEKRAPKNHEITIMEEGQLVDPLIRFSQVK